MRLCVIDGRGGGIGKRLSFPPELAMTEPHNATIGFTTLPVLFPI